MANGKEQQTGDRRFTAQGQGNMRTQFGAAYLNTIRPGGFKHAGLGNPFLKPGFGPAANKVNRGEIDRLPDNAFFTEEQVFAEQKRKLDSMGFTLEELNTPVLKPDGTPFMIGIGNTQVPAVMGDLLLGQPDEPFDNQVAGDVRRYATQAKAQGKPFTKLVADKYGGRKDEIIGVDAQGNAQLLNVQTQGTESASKIMRVAIPALAAAGIVGLGAFGPGGVFTSTAAPGAATAGTAGTTASVAGPAAATGAAATATGNVLPAAATGAAAGAAGNIGRNLPTSVLSSILGGNALPAAATLGTGLLAANQASQAGRTAARAQESAAQAAVNLQRDIFNKAQQEQLRQEQRMEPFRQAALRAIPGMEEAARAQADQINIDPNLLANLPEIPGFTGPDLTRLNEVIEELRAAPSFDLSPQGQAAIDIGTRAAERAAAAQGMTRSGNLLTELQQLGTEQAMLDFGRQEQLRQGRLAATIDSLQNLARLEAGTEQDQINAAILQREMERQSRLDPIQLQMMSRQMGREDQADSFNRLAALAGFNPGSSQAVTNALPTIGSIGRDVGAFRSAAGQSEAAGRMGAANTLFNTINNLGQQFGQSFRQQNLLNQLQSMNQSQPLSGQSRMNLGPMPQFNPVGPQILQTGLGGQRRQTGFDFIGAQANQALPGFAI